MNAPTLSAEARKVILVVDDEPMVLQALSAILAGAGYEVLGAANGDRALELYGNRDERIDVVLSDLTMPGIDGPQLARCLCERWPGMGVVFMSGYSAEMLSNCGMAAAAHFLQKPFTAVVLKAKLHELLQARAPSVRRAGGF